ncbi:hypothetical protein Y032_0255g343 [Ancylostoma ceylanicum]|nr:hypothetical protein Y032_0255g343 [Ancylostoma ceylanicum]
MQIWLLLLGIPRTPAHPCRFLTPKAPSTVLLQNYRMLWKFAFLSLAALSASHQNLCPDDEIFDPLTSRCYAFYYGKTWDEALAACRGHLAPNMERMYRMVTVPGERKNDTLRRILEMSRAFAKSDRGYVWLGAYVGQKRLTWVDGPMEHIDGLVDIIFWELHYDKNCLALPLNAEGTLQLHHLDCNARIASAGDVKTKWSVLEQAITEGTREIFGTTKLGRPFIEKQTWWWSEEVQIVVKKKKDAHKEWLKTRSDDSLREYREAKAEPKKAVATAKAARYRALYEELDTTGYTKEKKIYRISKARQNATEDLGHVAQIKDNDGRLLHRLPDILSRWREQCRATCNEEFPHPQMPTVNSLLGPVPRIDEEEVTAVLALMKNGKSRGPDSLPSEVWKIA